MKTWRQAFRAALYSGSVASLASTAVLVVAGRRELADGAAPLNGPSQWVWGRWASLTRGFSARHTVAGYAVHHVAATFWALLYEKWGSSRHPVAGAAATAAIANVVDFKCTPERLTPGFERRLSRPAVAAVYVAVALGLAAGGALARAQRPLAR
jgi:hypothetical protein